MVIAALALEALAHICSRRSDHAFLRYRTPFRIHILPYPQRMPLDLGKIVPCWFSAGLVQGTSRRIPCIRRIRLYTRCRAYLKGPKPAPSLPAQGHPARGQYVRRTRTAGRLRSRGTLTGQRCLSAVCLSHWKQLSGRPVRSECV